MLNGTNLLSATATRSVHFHQPFPQYYVGRLLIEIHRLHPTESVSAVQIAICNQATTEKAAYYRRLVEECSQLGCTECSTAKDSDGRTSTQRTSPCELTQRTSRLKDADFENCKTTFLDQCRSLKKVFITESARNKDKYHSSHTHSTDCCLQ